MSAFVKVLPANDNQWAVETDGELVAYASRGAAISAGVTKAIEEGAFLMIFEREVDAGAEAWAPIELRSGEIPE